MVRLYASYFLTICVNRAVDFRFETQLKLLKSSRRGNVPVKSHIVMTLSVLHLPVDHSRWLFVSRQRSGRPDVSWCERYRATPLLCMGTVWAHCHRNLYLTYHIFVSDGLKGYYSALFIILFSSSFPSFWASPIYRLRVRLPTNKQQATS